MSLEANVHRGARAREILENEEFQAAYDAIEQELTAAWKTSPQRDADGREKLFLALTMLSKIKGALVSTLETGKLSKLELNHQNPTMQNQAREYLGMNSLQ